MDLISVKIFTCILSMVVLCSTQRRVLNGAIVKSDKPYMVYLIKAPESHARYVGWLCGGAIIHPLHILTAASCIRDVYNVFVISGTREFVPEKEIDDHECTKKTKKRIVSMCEFKKEDYNVTQYYTYFSSSDTGYENNTQWAVGNLAVARVDSPFSFHGDDYVFCHYYPKIVSVNFLRKYEAEGTDAIVLGWGNKRFYRPVGDRKVYNEPVLRYTPTVVMNRKKCLEIYDSSNAYQFRSYNNIVCTFDRGNLDSDGVPFDMEDFCYDCEDTTPSQNIYRRWYSKVTTTKRPMPLNWMESFGHGNCQNDQGGPLVTWIGGRETVIGVASSFLVTTKMECKGPFIFSSTACSSKLIFCVMSSKARRSARDCNALARKSGQTIVETIVDWGGDNLQREFSNEEIMENKENVASLSREFIPTDMDTSQNDDDNSEYYNVEEENYSAENSPEVDLKRFDENTNLSDWVSTGLDNFFSSEYYNVEEENYSAENSPEVDLKRFDENTNLSDWVSTGLDNFFSQKSKSNSANSDFEDYNSEDDIKNDNDAEYDREEYKVESFRNSDENEDVVKQRSSSETDNNNNNLSQNQKASKAIIPKRREGDEQLCRNNTEISLNIDTQTERENKLSSPESFFKKIFISVENNETDEDSYINTDIVIKRQKNETNDTINNTTIDKNKKDLTKDIDNDQKEIVNYNRTSIQQSFFEKIFINIDKKIQKQKKDSYENNTAVVTNNISDNEKIK